MAFKDTNIDAAPGFQTDDVLVRAITVADNELDYAAAMSSRISLRLWEGSTWPEDDFTLDGNLEDMVTMEQRHIDGYAFGYTVMNPAETECLGCIYVMAPDAKMYAKSTFTPLTDTEWSNVDATVFFWIRDSRIPDGLDRVLLDELIAWFQRGWNCHNVLICTNEAFEQQVTMFEKAGLRRTFRIQNPDEPSATLGYST